MYVHLTFIDLKRISHSHDFYKINVSFETTKIKIKNKNTHIYIQNAQMKKVLLNGTTGGAKEKKKHAPKKYIQSVVVDDYDEFVCI